MTFTLVTGVLVLSELSARTKGRQLSANHTHQPCDIYFTILKHPAAF